MALGCGKRRPIVVGGDLAAGLARFVGVAGVGEGDVHHHAASAEITAVAQIRYSVNVDYCGNPQ